jgi:hypothetical protein
MLSGGRFLFAIFDYMISDFRLDFGWVDMGLMGSHECMAFRHRKSSFQSQIVSRKSKIANKKRPPDAFRGAFFICDFRLHDFRFPIRFWMDGYGIDGFPRMYGIPPSQIILPIANRKS